MVSLLEVASTFSRSKYTQIGIIKVQFNFLNVNICNMLESQTLTDIIMEIFSQTCNLRLELNFFFFFGLGIISSQVSHWCHMFLFLVWLPVSLRDFCLEHHLNLQTNREKT